VGRRGTREERIVRENENFKVNKNLDALGCL
jgi:hypothetical protein